MNPAAKKVARPGVNHAPEPEAPGQLLRASQNSLAEHRAQHGSLPSLSLTSLMASVQQQPLRTRDQQKRPIAEQLSHDTQNHYCRLVINACEPDPLHGHVSALCTTNAHLVLDGAELVAQALGIAQVEVITTHQGSPSESFTQALSERRAQNTQVQWTFQQVRGAFAHARDTAVIHLGLGGSPLPKPQHKIQLLMAKQKNPMVVYTAETCAAVAQAVLHPNAGATQLITIRQITNTVREIPVEDSLGTYLPHHGVDRVVLVGGAEGQWCMAENVAQLTADPATWTAAGLAPTHPTLWFPRADECPVAITSRLLHFLAGQSTGQCGPCINGVPALAHAFDRVAGADHLSEVASIGRLISGRGACRTPESATRLAMSAMSVLETAFQNHLDEKCNCGDADA